MLRMSDGYNGLDTADRIGCLGAAMVGIPVFLLLLGADALGDCAPATPCRKGFLLIVLLPTIAAVGLAFWIAGF